MHYELGATGMGEIGLNIAKFVFTVNCKTSKLGAQIEADQKMFVTGKYRIFVSVSDFPMCIITLHFTIKYRLCSDQEIPEPEKLRHFRKNNGLMLDRTFDVLQ